MRRAALPARNLVVVRAGDTSLHRGWGASAPDCRFDLIVSYFGDKPSAFRLPYENRVHRPGGKWDGIHGLFQDKPELLDNYDYFWFPDDDIEADAATINDMFDMMRKFDLDVAQPSLTLDSYYSHICTLTCRSFELRWIDAVEIMIPCIRRSTLSKILPLFRQSMSGFGLDLLWTRLAGDNVWKSAVFDSLRMRHTRPVGTALAPAMAKIGRSQDAEFRALQGQYGFGPPSPISYGALDTRGRMWRSSRTIGLRMVMDHVSEVSQFRQKEGLARTLRRLLTRQVFGRTHLSPINICEPR